MAANQVFLSLVVALSISRRLGLANNETSNLPTPVIFAVSQLPSTTAAQLDGEESFYNRTTDISPFFHIEPDSDSPDSVLLITFTTTKDFLHFKANYSDLSAISNGTHSSPTSALFTSSPFRLTGLTAGHQYKIEFYGYDRTENPQLVENGVASTAPSTPAFNQTSISTSNSSIVFVLQPPIDHDHQYLFFQYGQAESDQSLKSVNFSDAKKPLSSVTIDRLLPGRVYNVSVFMINKSGLWSKPWSSSILTNPNPPTDVSVRDRGSNFLSIDWKRPEESGLDEYHISYQDIRGGNPTDVLLRTKTFCFFCLPNKQPPTHSAFKIPLIPATNNKITISKGIDPGKTYLISVYSLKGSKSSSVANITAVAKPLPPTSIETYPDFERLKFRVRLTANVTSVLSGCRLEISSLLRSKTNETVAAQNHACDFYPELVPGDSYTFRGWTLSGQDEIISQELRVTKLVAPVYDEEKFEVKLVPDVTSVRVTWGSAVTKYWGPLVGSKGNFSARLRNEDGVESRDDVQMASPVGADAATSLSFNGLTYGTCYSLEIYTTTAGEVSNRSPKYFRTAIPETTVKVKNSNARSADVTVEIQLAVSKSSLAIDGSNSVDKPNKEESQKKELVINVERSCRILIQMLAENQSVVGNQTLENLNMHTKSWEVTFSNLQPFSNYLVSVMQQCGGLDAGESHCPTQRTKANQISFRTMEERPGPVRSLEVNVLNSSYVNLSWASPSEPNGRILGYFISVSQAKTQHIREQLWNLTVANGTFYKLLDNLTGGLEYGISVRAINSIGMSDEGIDGSTGRKRVDTPIFPPPPSTAKPQLSPNSVTQFSFTTNFDLNSFSVRNGFLTKYAIIVAEESFLKSNNVANEPLSWYQVENLAVWPPYIAKKCEATYNLALLSESIGAETCARSTENVQRPYCNGPLRSNRQYRVKVRGYTADEKFSDSFFSEIISTGAEPTPPAGPIVAGVVIVLVLLIVVITATLFLRTRGYLADPLLLLKRQARDNGQTHNGMTNKPRRTAGQATAGLAGGKMRPPPPGLPGRGCEPILDPRLSRIHQLPVAHTVISTADIERSRPVRKCDFAEHFRLMSADTDYRFSEEFEDLKSVGRSQPRSAADLPCNRAKNRFTNILPYDHSRVKLIPIDDEEGSEYINANYIPGFSSPREYIAAQGPLHSTRDDFWRMMWEQNCRNIVNLTRCIEKGREKCDQYWPIDTDPVYYGDVRVVLLNESRLPEWTVRELEMTCGNVVRIIKHFHYTAWPDFGVPDKPQSLVKFVKTFRAKMAKENGPIIVHCSAGVGRSGTFIAIDRLMQFVQSNDYLDIFGTVYEMRKERECMVQTEHQYICIHQVMLCVIDGREDDLGYALPYAEVHENPVFEDDEGIAESGF